MSTHVWSIVERLPGLSGEVEFSRAWQDNFAGLAGSGGGSGERALLEVMRDAGALQAGTIDPAWGGSWRWDLSGGAAKAVVTSAILYGVLVAAGVSGLLPIVVPTVLPILFELEKVRLTRDERGVIEIIGARKEIFERVGTSKQLYESLPAEVRESLTEREFAQFIESALAAGVATEHGDMVHVLSTGETVFRLKVV